MRPSTLRRLGLAFRIEWFLRGIPVLVLALGTAGCPATVKRCEFPLWVSVMPTEEADAECRRLGVKWTDDGRLIEDTDWIKGCAPKDRIIYNGQGLTGGHELAHQVERNCGGDR